MYRAKILSLLRLSIINYSLKVIFSRASEVWLIFLLFAFLLWPPFQPPLCHDESIMFWIFFGRFSPRLFFVFIPNEKLFFTQRVFLLCLMRQYRLKTWRWFRCFLLCFSLIFHRIKSFPGSLGAFPLSWKLILFFLLSVKISENLLSNKK